MKMRLSCYKYMTSETLFTYRQLEITVMQQDLQQTLPFMEGIGVGKGGERNVQLRSQWSFGVTCWKVFSAGKIPYGGVDPLTMVQLLESGRRLNKPSNAACSEEM